MIYIGIDPGKKGGIAVLTPEIGGIIAEAYQLTGMKLIEIIKGHEGNCFACIEKVGARPNQGVVSMFSFGEGYGYIKGVFDALDVPYVSVTPKKWKNHFGVTADKRTSITKAKELYGGVNLYPTSRSRVESDGLAEALLIASYGYSRYGKNRQQV